MRPSLRPPWPTQCSLLAWLPRATPHRVPRRIATTSAQNAAPVDIPKLPIPQKTPRHNSLQSFVEYAKQAQIPTHRAVYVGTHYEYITSLALMRLGFSTVRIGGKADAGIDLLGHWVLAPLREPLPVIIQCKARKIPINPNHIRELEGSFHGVPYQWKNKEVFGLLVTTMKATKGVLEALSHSRCPLGFVLISRDGLIQQFAWNRAASEKGLEGVGVTVRHTPRALLPEEEQQQEDDESGKPKKRLAKFKNAGTVKDIQLTWMGSPIFPEREQLDQKTVELMRSVAPDKYGDPYVPGVQVPCRGRQAQFLEEKITVPRPRGRPRTLYAEKLPSPRGGQIARVQKEHRGRPKGRKNNPKEEDFVPEEEEEEEEGEETPETPEVPEIRRKRIGRPPGSKNKPKAPVETG
ncbi:hypothetical protein P3342_006000 [Pyrenophora teres f. teres]|uniref:DUF2034 multi-domain protein n=2 Tax=Pyrenophora teres f. teres TaxID=97479 RepID=E3RRH8_PYRTT|nr:hypothetical protein PTT_11414 [Pyrenophora teres f. teres 0-1]KAE8845596.1 hypothetical protein HRS9139_00163 [Pyrenophora teres f. teres]KAE8847734.1 hypothetical protein PTNB85_01577 [Pyrenophora teres f. teres]KAE8854111.1 hypothetical protein HRS9122_01103 [Pyrenophora teres f. teres]KAE8867661.1 hypothetical protein PTNB29_01572 [Pyrenophora teres f. teres]